ncbi:MAG: UDP-galactopyranose mutase [Promethearchaeota archaeon]
MRILVVGTGISGCSIARLLKERNHDISLIEKQGNIGGLCITKISPNGLKYEPYGARIFHTKNSKLIEFITRFEEFNGYIHRRGLLINRKLFPLPLTKESLNQFEEKEQIIQELNNRPTVIDRTNYETACISIFGKTLYNYFIKNYTKKMWDVEPKNLTADWVSTRLEFRETNDNRYFKDEWQGLPKMGYTQLLNKIINYISVKLNTSEFDSEDYDMVVSSAPLDEIMQFKFGKLKYRSIRFDYLEDTSWEKNDIGTINLPQHPKYIRKCNFKIMHKQISMHNWIQFQEPIASDKNNVPMYPISTEENEKLCDKYLKAICSTNNICPIGRLGLYKYLDMDKAIEVAFNMVLLIENYLKLTPMERYLKIKEIRDRY